MYFCDPDLPDYIVWNIQKLFILMAHFMAANNKKLEPPEQKIRTKKIKMTHKNENENDSNKYWNNGSNYVA